MAIDKNSKAYQSLLNSGYTDEQITQMHSDVAGGQSTQEVVANTQPTTPSSTETPTPTETTPTVKQETEIKQPETVGSTVPEIKQEGALKPLSQDYYNQTSQEAQDKIVSNLNSYRQTNPEFFTDYESFKKNFSYDTRSDVQKNTLDTRYGGYQKGMQLAGLPTTELYTQYKDGQVSAAELENLRVYDPTKYAELQTQINKGNIVAAYDDDKGVDTTGMSIQDMAYQMATQTFQQFLSGDTSTGASNIFRQYEENMKNPEMLAISDRTTELQEEIENIQSDLDSIKKSVEEEYAGTGATRNKINAIIADRSYDLQLQLRTLNSEYNKYATQYNNRMQQYQTEFQMQLQEYQLGMQERSQKMDELGFAMDLMSFETPQQAQEREWEYRVKQQEYTNGNINSKDYQTRYKAAIKSVENLLAQYPNIPMQRSAEQMAQDILKAIDEGSDLGTELTKINKLIQEKPEYKYLYNQTFRPATSQGFGTSVNIGGQEYIEYNGKLYTAEEFNKQFGGASGKAKAYNPVTQEQLNTGKSNFFKNFDSKYKNGVGGQCGKFVNDYLQTIGLGRYYDDDLDTKLNSVNTQVATIGAIAVFDYGHKSSDGINHGHVGIVTDILPDGRIQILDSNYGSDGKIQERLIEPGSASLKGFFDPTIGSVVNTGTTSSSKTSSRGTTSSTTETTSQTPSNIDLEAQAMLKQIKTGNMTPSETSNARQWLINNGYGEEFLDALDKGIKVSLTDTQKSLYEYGMNTYKNSDVVKDFKEASTQIANLITSLDANNGAGDLAGIFQFMKVLDPSSVVREGEFKNAAKSAGYLNVDSLWQNYVKHGWDGTWLTEAQRGNFKQLAKNLIKTQAEMYNIEYSDLKKVFENAGIDKQWLPTNYAEIIINKLDGKTTTSTTQSNFYRQYANTAPGYQNTPVYENGKRVGKRLFN